MSSAGVSIYISLRHCLLAAVIHDAQVHLPFVECNVKANFIKETSEMCFPLYFYRKQHNLDVFVAKFSADLFFQARINEENSLRKKDEKHVEKWYSFAFRLIYVKQFNF